MRKIDPLLRDKFCVILAREGIKKVSPEIPASVHTLYRLLKGETKMPSLAVMAGIKRVIESREKDGKDGV